MIIRYDRQAAREYARKWWNRRNPDFVLFGNDCTGFVSQCMLAGGAPMTGQPDRGQGWWYEGLVDGQEAWSYSWGVANALRIYLKDSRGLRYGLKATEVASARDLTIGDVICYDWNGDGIWQHNTIVVGFTRKGSPLVAAHTYNSFNRLWRYRTSPRYSKKYTKYEFYHIADEFEMP